MVLPNPSSSNKTLQQTIHLLTLILVAGIFLDSFQTIFSPIVHIIIILTGILFFISDHMSSKTPLGNKEFWAMSTLFIYLIINAHITCCSGFNLRMLFRLGFAITIFYIFSHVKWKNFIYHMVFLTAILNIFIFFISIIGLVNPQLWLKFWDFFLTGNSKVFQLYEITRGRISATVPIFMTFIVPLPLLLLGKREKIIGIFSIVMGMISVLLWGYRSYILASLSGLIMFFWLLTKLVKLKNLQEVLSGQIKYSIIAGVIIAAVSYLLLSKLFLNVNIIDRFLLKYEIDQHATNVRWNFLSNTLELIKKSPLVGVGVGNSRLYQNPILIYLTSPSGENLGKELYYLPIDPHNLFFEYLAETGIIGFFLLLSLLALFARSDYYLYKHFKFEKEKSQKLFLSFSKLILAISSWIFLISVQFTSYTKGALYLFFLYRGLLSTFRPKQSNS